VTARILLVDDNPTNLQVLYQTLGGRGHELRVAKSGEDALAIARKVRPHLVLLDIMMPPGIDGFETLARLKAEPELAETAVILCSALDETKDKVRGLDLGAVDYITKPFEADEVIARVDTHLTLFRLRRDLARRNAELEAANRRMKEDLDAAARVQEALLPAASLELEDFDFAWRYRPCTELAGDALNLVRLDEDRVGLYVVDVSGHGVPAALLSVAVTRSLSPSADPAALVPLPGASQAIDHSPADTASRLNTLYPMAGNGNHYFTLIYGILDATAHTFRFVTAGHPGPVVVPRDGGGRHVLVPSLPLGIVPHVPYADSVVELAPGDRVYLLSDGLYEERRDDGTQFGLERLTEALTAHRRLPLDRSLDAVLEDLATWRGDDRFTDDVSVLGVERIR